MHTRQHIQKKAPSSSSSTPVPTSIFRQRPSKNEADSAVSPQQETPDLQTQLERATRFGHNFGQVQVGDTPAAIQPKLAIGAPGDKYEQEADQTAAQVMSMAAPANQQSVQREIAPEEKEKLQTKPLAASITPLVQREMTPKPEEEEEQVQAKPLAGFTIQREVAPKPEEEEEPLQAKPLAGFTIQREVAPKPEEEEQPLQAKPLAGFTIQREMAPKPEEEEQPLQAKPSLQRATEAGGNDAGSNLESRLSSSKGGGSPLSDEVRSFMEPRFGADFSQVRVHTDSQAVQMNKAVGAQAFTHSSDIYFGAGKAPGNNELTAHELTHVVQQTNNLQRKANLGVTYVGDNYIQCDPSEEETPSYRPDIHHDHGFLDDGHGNIDETKRRAPEFSDYAALAWWETKLNAAEVLRPDLIDGTAAYRHFLFGNGATRTIDYERFIANDPSGQIIITSAVRDIVDLAREHHNQFLQANPGSTEAQTFNVHTEAIPVGGTEHYPYPATENWQKAIGAHIIWLEGSVTVNINAADNTRSFEIDMTLHMEDMYNFNPGAADIATGAPDSANGRFEVTGLAHEYLNTAVVHRTITSPSEPMNTASSDSSNPHVDDPRIPPVRTPDDGRGTGSR